jgi:hypothetical protein
MSTGTENAKRQKIEDRQRLNHETLKHRLHLARDFDPDCFARDYEQAESDGDRSVIMREIVNNHATWVEVYDNQKEKIKSLRATVSKMKEDKLYMDKQINGFIDETIDIYNTKERYRR